VRTWPWVSTWVLGYLTVARISGVEVHAVAAHNGGPNATTALQVTDPVPAGLTFVSATPSQGTYNAGTGVWDVGALASGAGATLQLRVTVNGTTPVTNTATRSSSTPVDPNPSNDSASTVVTGRARATQQRCPAAHFALASRRRSDHPGVRVRRAKGAEADDAPALIARRIGDGLGKLTSPTG